MVGLPRKSVCKSQKQVEMSEGVIPDGGRDVATDGSDDVVNAKIPNTADKSKNGTETAEERKARIHAERMKNLAKAHERGKEVMAQRKAERERMKETLKDDKKKLMEMKRDLERQKIATKWVQLERQKAKIEKVIKRSAPAPVQRLDEDTEEEEEEPEVKPKMRRTKPVRRQVVESDDEPEVPPMPRLTRSFEPPAPRVIVQDPISSLTTAQIRDDLRKMQLQMMAKQLWGNL